jgi:hypothetical protein
MRSKAYETFTTNGTTQHLTYKGQFDLANDNSFLITDNLIKDFVTDKTYPIIYLDAQKYKDKYLTKPTQLSEEFIEQMIKYKSISKTLNEIPRYRELKTKIENS